jgi:DNA (cytosine-5)-methyltransferase 1
VPEGYLDLLMASPTCTHHSRARGGKPTSDQQRADPWHVITWLTELRVKRMLIENVPEFVDWGPVDRRTGKPVKSRKGEYFRAWWQAIEALGGRGEYRFLNCADYGDCDDAAAILRDGLVRRGAAAVSGADA